MWGSKNEETTVWTMGSWAYWSHHYSSLYTQRYSYLHAYELPKLLLSINITFHYIPFFLSPFSNYLEEILLNWRWRIAFRSSDWFWLCQVKLLQNSSLPFHIESNSNEVFSVQYGQAAEAICTDTKQASFAKDQHYSKTGGSYNIIA